MDIEIRSLLVTDVFTVARMLSKVAGGARAEIAAAIKAGKNSNPTELGMVMFQTMFVETEEDMKEWLANLIGKTKEEFLVMPARTVPDIIRTLVKQEDAKDFFAQASRLVAGEPEVSNSST